MKTSTCRGCGKEIIFGIEPETGRSIPLDPRPPVYRIRQVGANVEAIRERMALVSHFATCPKAAQFSKRRRTSSKGAPTAPPASATPGSQSQ